MENQSTLIPDHEMGHSLVTQPNGRAVPKQGHFTNFKILQFSSFHTSDSEEKTSLPPRSLSENSARSESKLI